MQTSRTREHQHAHTWTKICHEIIQEVGMVHHLVSCTVTAGTDLLLAHSSCHTCHTRLPQTQKYIWYLIALSIQ